MQCVILAGGLGTRMWPEARMVPKHLLPVAGRPFAGWQLEWLAAAGVDSVVYCIGFLGDRIRDYVGTGEAWGLAVSYVDEGDRLRGTAGALALAGDLGVLRERFLVLYGDSLLSVDPARVHQAAVDSGLPALMTVFENDGRWDASNVVCADGLVLRYEKNLHPRPAAMRWIDYGLSVLSRPLVAADALPDSDLAPLFSRLARQRLLAAYVATERFYEIGSPAGRAAAEAVLASRGR